MTRPALEVAQIFRHHGPDYRENQRLSPVQHKTMRAIERCRTARLGGHVDLCSQGCGYLAISYNSCRNRHCPKCQSLKQAKWLAERLERLLPTNYFHLVVTLPHELNPLALYNPELVYNLLFESVSRALQQFARDYERLQAQVGFTAVLHTWDQVLNLHPHLHLVVTGGGLSADGDRWIAARNSFLLPVRALSKIIRGKFLDGLQQAYQEGRLEGQVQCLEDPVQFRRFTRKLRRKKWVVYAKGSFEASRNAYHYLSRYTHRVAIANHRLVNLAEGKVSFRARDNSRPGHQRLMTITAPEFIRRFLLHVLPPRFVKIRHYGLMAPCNAKTKLEKARALISLQAPLTNDKPKDQELDTSNETKTW
ncbi:MAG: IS91 family transposase, partial [Syntrophales bacterium]|nr:IS91 family transposase [Syntrophales bacterium]